MDINWKLARKKNALHIRAAMIQAIRGFFIDRDYLEWKHPPGSPAPLRNATLMPSPRTAGTFTHHPSYA